MKRQAYFADKFYPGNKEELLSYLKDLYSSVDEYSGDDALAIISPHAGYVYSGEVAAASYIQINQNKKYKNIFILASSHRIYFNGASTYSVGNYETPLGEVRVNTDLCNSLIKNHRVFSYIPEAHIKEHSIEVQLPFLQVRLNNDFQIVPIIIGADNIDDPQEIAEALEPYFNDDNLFVVSSDFSHYPNNSLANKIDEKTADVICDGDFNKLVSHLSKTLLSEFDNKLDTCLCGASAVNVLMRLAKSNCNYNKIIYQNSGNHSDEDGENVVGYWAISLTKKNNKHTSIEGFNLSETEKIELLKIAEVSVKSKIKNTKFNLEDFYTYSENITKKCGAFVSLYVGENLRGCIGMLTSDLPLVETIEKVAIKSAFEDDRFVPLADSELDELNFEISVLSQMKKIKSIDEIILGKHGIYLVNQDRTGAFLPQVATKYAWTKQEFLEVCAVEKLGLDSDAWKKSDIYIFEAIVFSNKDFV